MGGSDDFDAFYNATSRRLLHQIYAMTGNLADAQDCMQEAFARAWQHWQQVRRADDPAAWVRTVAWRIAASRWRKARNGVRAIVLHHLVGMPVEEVAREAGAPSGPVKARTGDRLHVPVRRGRRRIRRVVRHGLRGRRRTGRRRRSTRQGWGAARPVGLKRRTVLA
jgi:DNA-directed RNA polymerase specialized sigma24 family protein